MKISAVLSYTFLFLFPFSILAQNIVSEKQFHWNDDSSAWQADNWFEFKYDENNYLINQREYNPRYLENDWEGLIKSFDYFYSGTGNLEQEEIYFIDPFGGLDPALGEDAQIYKRDSIVYETNPDGCRTQELKTTFYKPSDIVQGVKYQSKQEWTYLEGCKLTEYTSHTKYDDSNDWYFSNKFEFEHAGDTIYYKIFWDPDLTGTLEFMKSGFRRFDETGRILEFLGNSENNPIYARRWIYNYAPDGTYIVTNSFKPNNFGEFEKWAYDSIHFSYNVQNQLVEEFHITKNLETSNQFEPVIAKDYKRFKYYCDGILKEVNTESFFPFYLNKKTIFEYDNHSDCEETLESPEITIYPNPASNILKIVSPVLSEKNATIAIYSMAGTQVFFEKKAGRTDYFEVDVSHLPKGTYVVNIESQFNRIAEKLMIWQ